VTADVRRIAAALANPRVREVYARIVLGRDPSEGTTAAKVARAIATLESAGLVDDLGSSWAASDEVFRELLAQQPARVVATGVERFLVGGRIDRYPSSQDDRRSLLEWVVDRAFAPGEVLDEKQVNERLMQYIDDFAVLRRYLVDFGLLERTASGSTYSRVVTG